MKYLTHEEVQQVSLEILLDVHDFCIKNDIKYSLAYGTLIGAIRHKGFIPWDDDVDIIMPRPDFDKFCKTYNSDNGYKVLSPDSSDSYIMYGRVYDTKRTFVETRAPFSTFETGLWIDVFPLDGVENSYVDFSNRLKKLKPIAHKISLYRTSREKFWKVKTLRRKCTWIIKKIFLCGNTINSLRTRYINSMKSIPYGSTGYYGQIGCFDGSTHKEHNPISDFTETIEVEFEGHNLLALKGYDNTLRRYYGDYMQLPPEEDRIPQQDSYIKFYWKN